MNQHLSQRQQGDPHHLLNPHLIPDVKPDDYRTLGSREFCMLLVQSSELNYQSQFLAAIIGNSFLLIFSDCDHAYFLYRFGILNLLLSPPSPPIL